MYLLLISTLLKNNSWYIEFITIIQVKVLKINYSGKMITKIEEAGKNCIIKRVNYKKKCIINKKCI